MRAAPGRPGCGAYKERRKQQLGAAGAAAGALATARAAVKHQAPGRRQRGLLGLKHRMTRHPHASLPRALVHMQATVHAMTTVGIPAVDQEAVFCTVAAILSMGNIKFVPGDDEESCVLEPSKGQHFLEITGAWLGGGGVKARRV